MDDLLDKQEKREYCDYEDCAWVENLGVSFQAMRQALELTDMKLRAGDTEFPCHRVVLAASSPFFRALLTGPMKEESRTTFDLQDTCSSTLSLLLDFMYTGKLRITEENVQDVLVSANYLLLGRLVDACSDFLRRQLDFQNCFEMYSFADAHGCEELLRATQRYILRNLPEASSSPAFLEAGFEQLRSLLGEDNLNVSSEMDLFRSIMDWVSHDVQDRSCHLLELLRLVRLPYLPTDNLNLISNDKLIAANPGCKTVLHNAHLCKEDLIPYPIEWRSPRSSTNQVEVLVVLGGVHSSQLGNSSSLQHYWCDPRSQLLSWSKHSAMPHMLRNTVMYDVTKFRNDIYVIGGFDGEQGTLGHVWRYQIDNDQRETWGRVPALITSRYQHGSGVAGGHLFVAGGYDGREALNNVECFSPGWERWQPCPPMPEAVTFPAVVGYHKRLFVIGGMKSDSCAFPWIQCFDMATQSWSIIKTLELKSKGSKSVLLNDAIYIIGGPSNQVHVYDPENDVSFDVAPTLDIHVCAGVTVNNGKIYVAGGDNLKDRQNWNSVECYDPASNTWSIIGKMVIPLYWHGLVSIVRPNMPPMKAYLDSTNVYEVGPSMMFRGFQEGPPDHDPR
ncbi:kelch-like protein 24 isoform X2 [Strongylocentrotus purpuratus]|uniref:BTB domain-containing protein n=1 Tax=Strongylocentrotus purpuratus TaxID=7668 RepID=A0A7M7NMR8_STRPU|nr:kelch-like protein 24 isoform X2 [Strongylocentrotus purpuratus]